MCACSVAQSCTTLCNPMDYSPPGSSVHRILQARILEWVVISSWLRDRICISCIGRRVLYRCATWKAQRAKNIWHKRKARRRKSWHKTSQRRQNPRAESPLLKGCLYFNCRGTYGTLGPQVSLISFYCCCCLVAQSCLTVCNPCNTLGSCPSLHGIIREKEKKQSYNSLGCLTGLDRTSCKFLYLCYAHTVSTQKGWVVM